MINRPASPNADPAGFTQVLKVVGAQNAAVDKVQQLSASFNKAARAVRLSMMLKHEVVGLRPLPQLRATAASAGPANENAAPKGGGSPHRLHGERSRLNHRHRLQPSRRA